MLGAPGKIGSLGLQNVRDPAAVVGGALAIAVFTALGDSLIPGRSNADSGRDANDPEVVNGFQYVNHSSQSDYQQVRADASPIWHSDDGVARISPIEAMLREYQSTNGNHVAVIPCGDGGTSLDAVGSNDDWNPNGPGTVLLAAQAAHNAGMTALAAEGAVTCAAVIGSLGSNDLVRPDYDSATYQQLWIDYFAWLRANLNGVTATTPFVFGGPVGTGTAQALARADLEAAAAASPYVFIEHSLYPTSDVGNLHPPKDEARNWGTAFAVMADHAIKGTLPIPTITTNIAQSSSVDTDLSLALHHTGLDDDSPYGVIEENGGADAGEFTLGGDFHAPTLEQVDPDLVAGDYEKILRVKTPDGRYGPDVTFTITKEAAASSPVSLFNPVTPEPGYVIKLSDLSTLFQDIAGTIPVSAAGQRVGKILDQSPNSNDFTARADDNTRPTLMTDGGSNYLLYTGGQALFANIICDDGAFEFSAMHGVQAAAQSGSTEVLSQGGGATSFYLMISCSGDGQRIFVRNSTSTSANTPAIPGVFDNTKKIISAQAEGSNGFMRMRDEFNRPTWTSTNVGTFAETTNDDELCLGGRPNSPASALFNGRIGSGYGIGRITTEPEQVMAGDWTASEFGATLP